MQVLYSSTWMVKDEIAKAVCQNDYYISKYIHIWQQWYPKISSSAKIAVILGTWALIPGLKKQPIGSFNGKVGLPFLQLPYNVLQIIIIFEWVICSSYF